MASQGNVVCTFTVTVILVRPEAIVGGTKDKQSLIIQNNCTHAHIPIYRAALPEHIYLIIINNLVVMNLLNMKHGCVQSSYFHVHTTGNKEKIFSFHKCLSYIPKAVNSH